MQKRQPKRRNTRRGCGREGAASWPGFGAERISETTHGVNQFYGLVLIDLPAKEAHKGVESVLFDVFRRPPYGVENGMAGGDASFVAHKEFEQTKFRRGELDFPSSAEDATLGDFQCKVADTQRMSSRLGNPALQRTDTGEQYGKRERLRHIIVGSRIESLDDIGDGVASSKHQNGNVLLEFAEPARDLNAIHPGQHHIEEDKVEVRVLRKGKRREAVVGKAYGMTVFFEPSPEHLRHALFVFDYQDLHLN